ncbi:hypothetical protein [Thermococcus sp.]|uniref:hypothetical protein n=1 Tax=Thermococcus sp. TaxID=35749 RepID=UPI00262EE8A6|nr:hypothetical protein [Thermococcus sp.]
MILRSLLSFLFFHLPRITFQIAGILRAIKRGKRAFRKALKAEGLPKDAVEELVREFDPLENVSLGELLRSPPRFRR